MGQFSVTFPIAAGSVLSDIQHSKPQEASSVSNVDFPSPGQPEGPTCWLSWSFVIGFLSM